ncbi:MAG: tetratricopeptide repeat protein [Brevinematia bacterium]
MITKNDIDKILSSYKEGDLVRASQLGKGLFKELPKELKKIVEISNFLVGMILSGNIEEIIDYSSHIDVILSKIFFLEGNFEKYRNVAYKVLENSKDPLTIMYSLKEIKMFDPDNASKLYSKYSDVRIKSKRAEYLRKFLENNFREALKEISIFLSEKPHPEILLDLADIWYYTDQYRELSDLFLPMYREEKINDYFMYLYAYSLYSSGRVHDAISILEKLAKKYPKNINIIYNLSASYYRNGNFDKSEELIELAENITNHPIIHFSKGIFLYRLGKYKESKQEFLKLEQNDEFYFSSEYNASICDYRMKNYEEAITRLIKLRNEKSIDKKNFDAINKTIIKIKKDSRKFISKFKFLILLLLSLALGVGTYLLLVYLKLI